MSPLLVTGGHGCRLLLIVDGLADFTLSTTQTRSLLYSQVEGTTSTRSQMASQRTSQQPWDVPYPPTQQRFGSEEDEDTKAPYDDLIDQYAIPYRQNSTHKAYNVDSTAFKSSDPKNYALAQKASRTTEGTGKDLEGGSSDGHAWAYPPPTSNEQTTEKASFWETVRI